MAKRNETQAEHLCRKLKKAVKTELKKEGLKIGGKIFILQSPCYKCEETLCDDCRSNCTKTEVIVPTVIESIDVSLHRGFSSVLFNSENDTAYDLDDLGERWFKSHEDASAYIERR